MKNLAPLFALLLVCISSAFTTAHPTAKSFAHVDYFLKLEGVDGESADKDHKKWIEIESMNIDRAGKTISIQRAQTSKSSTKLMEACASGQHFKKAVLHVRKSGGDNYMKIELENVLITSYQTSAATSSSRPMESLSLNYSKAVFN